MQQLVSTLAAGEPQPRRKPPRNQLADLAQRVRTEHQAIIAATVSGLEHAMAAGDLLIEAKKSGKQSGKIAHGQWTEWVERHCEISLRTAQFYMCLAENRATIRSKAQCVALLTMQAAAELIAAPKIKTTTATMAATTPSEVEPKKRSTRHELMAVWINTPAEDRLHFMNDVGLMWRRDAERNVPAPAINGIVVASKWKVSSNISDDASSMPDLSIPECLRVAS